MRFVPVIALLALSTPALARQDAGADKKPEAEKKICRSVVATGSIMGKRECHTKAEWAAMSQRSTDARDRLDRDFGGRPGATGLGGRGDS